MTLSSVSLQPPKHALFKAFVIKSLYLSVYQIGAWIPLEYEQYQWVLSKIKTRYPNVRLNKMPFHIHQNIMSISCYRWLQTLLHIKLSPSLEMFIKYTFVLCMHQNTISEYISQVKSENVNFDRMKERKKARKWNSKKPIEKYTSH